jgi:hypothetical protein
MKRYFFILFIYISILNIEKAIAQITYTIGHSSTCAGSPISFTSTVFETAQFPTSIIWNFGDTASGLLNTA